MAYHSRLGEARERLRAAGESSHGSSGAEGKPKCGPQEMPDFKTFFEDLGTVFHQAEKLMKAGLTQGELEAAKLSLRNAYAELGHAAGTLWEERVPLLLWDGEPLYGTSASRVAPAGGAQQKARTPFLPSSRCPSLAVLSFGP